MLAAALLALRLADPLTPSLTTDFDGDGREETVTAAPARGAVRLDVRDANRKKLADAKAPAPPGDVVHVALSAGAIGSAGALLLITASTDASECVSVWRYRTDGLTRLPIREAGGKDAPDCGPPNVWTYRWENAAEGRPSELVRERTETTPQGDLRVRDAFAFAGFSLDADAAFSSRQIGGVAIPAWYDAVLYSTPALEALYARYDLSRIRSEPTLRILADRERGVFALRFSGQDGEVTAPVDAFAASRGKATLGARSGDKTLKVTVRLGGEDGSVPLLVEVAGLGPPFDQLYGPAGSLHGRAAKVFPSADDEIASEELAGTWVDTEGGQTTIALAGESPFAVRVDSDLYALDRGRAERPVDLVLVPKGSSGRAWGIVLRGRNVLERVPVVCPPPSSEAPAGPCRSDGPPQRFRRLGARANAQ